jgi:hypothetical protein
MVPTAHLVDEDHSAQAFVIGASPDAMFDVAAARAAGDPAYFTSMGALQTMHGELREYIPVDAENLLAATAVRVGAISTHHLLGQDRQPLPIVYLAA